VSYICISLACTISYLCVYFVFCFLWVSFVAFFFSTLILLLGLLTSKNRLPYNLYCVGGDVKLLNPVQMTKYPQKYGTFFAYTATIYVLLKLMV